MIPQKKSDSMGIFTRISAEPHVQAEAMAEVQAEVFRGMLDSSLATKTDLKGGTRRAAVRSA